jgi:hypothetical protein
MTEERPLCECHGVEMLWNRSQRKAAGGYWRCRMRIREHCRKYYAVNKGRQLARNRDWYAVKRPGRQCAEKLVQDAGALPQS